MVLALLLRWASRFQHVGSYSALAVEGSTRKRCELIRGLRWGDFMGALLRTHPLGMF